MTETTTNIEAQPEETTFGIDVRDALSAYRNAVREAGRVRDSAVRASQKKYDTAAAAVRDLLGWGGVADSIINLLDTLTYDKRQAVGSNADEMMELARKQARSARDEALRKDPFAAFVDTRIARDYGESFAEPFYEAMPLTFTKLKKLAEEQGWCSEYEDVMGRAVEEGALPDEKVTVRRSVDWTTVPVTYSPKAGEEWEAVLTLPAFVRTEDSSGRQIRYRHLQRFVTEVAYERKDTTTTVTS